MSQVSQPAAREAATPGQKKKHHRHAKPATGTSTRRRRDTTAKNCQRYYLANLATGSG